MLSALRASHPWCWLRALLVQGSAQAAESSSVYSSLVQLEFLQLRFVCCKFYYLYLFSFLKKGGWSLGFILVPFKKKQLLSPILQSIK